MKRAQTEWDGHKRDSGEFTTVASLWMTCIVHDDPPRFICLQHNNAVQFVPVPIPFVPVSKLR